MQPTSISNLTGTSAEKSCGTYRDHVGRHTVTNEQEDVLGSADLVKISDEPVGDSGRAVVVGEGSLVLARVTKRNSSVCLGGDIDKRWLLGISGKKI